MKVSTNCLSPFYDLSHSRLLSLFLNKKHCYFSQEDGYDSVLRNLEKVLDYFEDELGRDERVGVWLGGAQLCLADVTLGRFPE